MNLLPLGRINCLLSERPPKYWAIQLLGRKTTDGIGCDLQSHLISAAPFVASLHAPPSYPDSGTLVSLALGWPVTQKDKK